MSYSGHDKEHWPLMTFICEPNGGIRRIPSCWAMDSSTDWQQCAERPCQPFHFHTIFGLIFKKGEYNKSHVWIFKINLLTCEQGPFAEQAPNSYT